jgi:3-phenylpropionate/trans-cinnamate dioxygenase ferredoxin subunit
MKQVFVCPLQDLPQGTMRAFRVEGREIVFVHSGERVYALRDVCPHQGARLSDGMITCERIAGAVGEYQLKADGCAVRCPWHNWEFNLADGAALHDPVRIRVSAYQTYIHDGRIFVVL